MEVFNLATAKIKIRVPSNSSKTDFEKYFDLLKMQDTIEISKSNINSILDYINSSNVKGNKDNIKSLLTILLNKQLRTLLLRRNDIYYLMIEHPHLDKILVIKAFAVQKAYNHPFLVSTLDLHIPGQGSLFYIQVIDKNQEKTFKCFDKKSIQTVTGFENLFQAINHFIESGDVPIFYMSNEEFVQTHHTQIFRICFNR